MRSTKNRPAIDRSIAIYALDMPGLEARLQADIRERLGLNFSLDTSYHEFIFT
jgi:hypothetical protein